MSSLREIKDAPATNSHHYWIQQQQSSSICSDVSHGGNDDHVPSNHTIDLEAGTRISEAHDIVPRNNIARNGKDNMNDHDDDEDDDNTNRVSHKVSDPNRKQMEPMEEQQQSYMVASNASTRQANSHSNFILDSSIVAASTSVLQRHDDSERSTNVASVTSSTNETTNKLHTSPVGNNFTTTNTAKHSRMIVDVDEYINDDDVIEDEEILLDSTVIISNVSTTTPLTHTDGRSTSLLPIIEGTVPIITSSSNRSITIPVEVRDEPIRVGSAAAPPQQHPTIPPITRTIFDVDDEIDEDFTVPALTAIPQRTKSQEMALKAVLENDKDVFDTDTSKTKDENKKAIWVSSNASVTSKQTTTTKTSATASVDGTDDLLDDEIGAIIPPPLQRQTRYMQRSSPGAYPVTPTSSSMIVSNSGAHRNRRTYPILDCEHDDPTGESDIISATLVEDDTYCGLNNNTTYMSEMSHTNPTTIMNDSPILVHAERLWWKRRLVLCLSVWMLCAVAVVSVSVTLAAMYMRETENESPESTPEVVTPSSPATSVPILANTPTLSPVDIRIAESPTPSLYDIRTAVTESLTLVPTASENSFSNETGIRTSMNAVSLGVVTTCTNEIDISSFDIELSCGGKIFVHQEENVLCNPEQTSAGNTTNVKCKWNNTPSYPNTTTTSSNEVSYQQITGQVLFSCQGFDSRDVTPVSKITNGTITNCSSSTSSSATPLQATSYMSLGSFCEDDHMDYSVRTFVSNCDEGKRWGPIKFSALLDALFGSVLPDSFCYDSGSCSLPGSVSWVEDPPPPPQCTIASIPDVVVSSTTVFDEVIKLCADPFMEVENIQIDKMWNLASTTLNSTQYIDVIIRNEFN